MRERKRSASQQSRRLLAEARRDRRLVRQARHREIEARETALRAAPGQRWLLASDGVRPRALRQALERTREKGPAEAAEQVLALAGRDDDDASVLVMDFSEAR